MGLKGERYRDELSCMLGTSAAEGLAQLKDESFDVVWTDPPYGLPMSHNGEFGFHLNDDFKTTDAAAVMVQALEECARVLTPLGEMFCCIAGPSFGDAYAAIERLGFKAMRTLTWDKGSASPTFPGFAWKNSSELLIYAAKGIDTNFKTHGGQLSVIRANRCAGKERVKNDEGKSLHPTQKPLALIDACLANARPGKVLDPFAGVGSTLIAARRVGRKCLGIELDPKFYEPAVKRLQEEANG